MNNSDPRFAVVLICAFIAYFGLVSLLHTAYILLFYSISTFNVYIKLLWLNIGNLDICCGSCYKESMFAYVLTENNNMHLYC